MQAKSSLAPKNVVTTSITIAMAKQTKVVVFAAMETKKFVTQPTRAVKNSQMAPLDALLRVVQASGVVSTDNGLLARAKSNPHSKKSAETTSIMIAMVKSMTLVVSAKAEKPRLATLEL